MVTKYSVTLFAYGQPCHISSNSVRTKRQFRANCLCPYLSHLPMETTMRNILQEQGLLCELMRSDVIAGHSRSWRHWGLQRRCILKSKDVLILPEEAVKAMELYVGSYCPLLWPHNVELSLSWTNLLTPLLWPWVSWDNSYSSAFGLIHLMDCHSLILTADEGSSR